MYNQDQLILRDLAKQLQTLSETPQAKQTIKDWVNHNALRGNRPMILAFPEYNAWHQDILKDEQLQCHDPALRDFERALRQRLYQATIIRDDSPITNHFNINHIINTSFYGDKFKLVATRTSDANGSYHYEKCIHDIEEDFDKLAFRTVQYEEEKTHNTLHLAQDTFGDILDVRLRGPKWWTLGLTWEAIKLIGLEDLMIYMYDDPEGLHRLMQWLSTEHLHYIESLKNLGVLTSNTEDDGIGSGGYGYSDEIPNTTSAASFENMWGFSESQETVGISPQMFGEFIFPYQLPLLEKFPLNCYGCCEPLEGRWDLVSTIPRLRRVSVSPWANMDTMKELLGKDYIYSRKPNPAHICVNFNEDALCEDLSHAYQISKNTHMEIIMKDVQTLQNDPLRISRWVEMARSYMQ